MLPQSLPLVYSSLVEHQAKDDYCGGINDRPQTKLPSSEKFQRHKCLFCFYPKKAKRRRWIVPVSLREMLLKYFQDSEFLATWVRGKRIIRSPLTSGGPRCVWRSLDTFVGASFAKVLSPHRTLGLGYIRRDLCTAPMERQFIDFLGPLSSTKRGSMGILVTVESFSKYVSFCPVRRMTSAEVSDYLERYYFPTFGVPKSMVSDNAKTFGYRQFKDLCFKWGSTISRPHLINPRPRWRRVNRNLKAALKIFTMSPRTCGIRIYSGSLSHSIQQCTRARVTHPTSCFWARS